MRYRGVTSILLLPLLLASYFIPALASGGDARAAGRRVIIPAESSATRSSADRTDSQEPHAKPDHPVTIGLASYYSKTFDGKKTASGKTFHANQLVAAHRTYPFGTIVCVTRLDNEKSVQVRIIDRGPFGTNRKKGTIIDLSRAAAEQLDMLKKGLVRVRVEVLTWGKG